MILCKKLSKHKDEQYIHCVISFCASNVMKTETNQLRHFPTKDSQHITMMTPKNSYFII